MQPSGTASTESESTTSGATSAVMPICYCERPACMLTSYTEKNFGRRFVKCQNYKINRACGFWQWVDPKMCSHGERVIGRLREWHGSLIQDAERCRTMVETEVAKLKVNMGIEEAERCRLIVEAEVAKLRANMEIENAALRKEIEIQGINYQTMKKIYKTIIVCTWILMIVYLLMAGSESKGAFDSKHDRMLLP